MVWKGGAGASGCLFSSGKPVFGGKVDSFCAVEAQVEAAVVSSSVEDYKFACFLLCLHMLL